MSFFVKEARFALTQYVSAALYISGQFSYDDNSLLRILESCNIVNVKQCKVDKY